jgi:hypothetical protein
VVEVDGNAFVPVSYAAARLGYTEEKVRRLVREGVFAGASVESLPSVRRGRRPSLVVRQRDVEAQRSEELVRLGAVEPCPDDCPGKSSQATTADELARLRAEVSELREVVRLSLLIDVARVDQLRAMLPMPTSS